MDEKRANYTVETLDHIEERFDLDPQLAAIFRNTAERFDGTTD